MKKPLLCLATGLLVLACSGLPAARRAPVGVHVTVAHAPDADSWLVSFESTAPVDSLIFLRQINRFRAERWQPLDQAVVIRELDGKERIMRSDGQAFQSARFRIATDARYLPKDYAFFLSFTDGGRAVYSGHLSACPEAGCSGAVRFSFVPRPGEKVIVGDPGGKPTEGTYAYFGNARPLETRHLVAILDPGLPPWLLKRFHDLLPKLLDFYTRKTGYSLGFKPFVLLSYSADGQGRSDQGGTLPGQVVLDLRGEGWSRPNPESVLHLGRFLAHECAHLWNSQRFSAADTDMWMHEGGADAFAFRALSALGIVSPAGARALESEALNECLDALRDRPLRDVNEDPHFSSRYTCGSTIALITEESLRQATHGRRGLFDFWQRLFAAAESSGQPYTEEQYFETWRGFLGDDELVPMVRRWLSGPLKGSSRELIEDALSRAGVSTTELTSGFPPSYERERAREALKLLMQADCQGRFSFSTAGAGFRLGPLAGCQAFAGEFTALALEGHALNLQGAEAYDALHARCKSARTVRLTGANGELEVACPQAIPTRQPPLRID